MSRRIEIPTMTLSGKLNQYGKECSKSEYDTGRSDGSGTIEIYAQYWKSDSKSVTVCNISIEASCPDDMAGNPYPKRSDKSLIEDATELLRKDFFRG